jgi:multidrug efflux pump
MARFFIDRPVFAWVLAIVIMLAGGLSILSLPIAQYPQIAPPTVSISATYPGASAQTVEDSVTQIIEQRMTGLDGLTYMSSTSDSAGSSRITLTFDAGTDPDIAQVQVQNQLQLATRLLPQAVQAQGVRVTKSSADFLMVIGFVSTDGRLSANDMSDFLAANLQDPLSRVAGVGNVQVFGAPYAMRIWLDPARLASYKLMPSDVSAAVQTQNAQVSAGQLGATPAVPGQQLNATITSQGRLQTVEQFENILLVTTPDGAAVHLRDVARVELGADDYTVLSRFNGKAATGMAVNLATGANALSTAAAVKARVAELAPTLPTGVEVVVPFDTTPFVQQSISAVVATLFEAILLVFLVMYLFLQNWRATLIPTIAVPVVLLGTFGMLSVLGYSINTLTMFAMVLAIGLLVDDAIVVVENVERVMEEEGLSAIEATRKSMDEITGALVGIGLVLCAVFVPMAFFGGSTGVIYRQFSITIVSAMVFSVIVALTLTPALCATLLKEKTKGQHGRTTGFFGWFNRNFDRMAGRYQSGVGAILGKWGRYALIYVAIVVVLALLFMRLPTSFVPEEDQGVMFTQIQLPTGATQGRTLRVMEQVESYYLGPAKEGVESVFGVVGFGFAGGGQNSALAFVKLKDWDERTDDSLSVSAIAARAMRAFSAIKDAQVFAFSPPAIPGLGTASGFTLQLQDEGGLGHERLTAARNQLLRLAAQEPGLAGVRPNGQEDTPQLQLDIDHAKASALGVSVADINSTLAIAWGGAYVNDFIDRGRVKRVYLQGDAPSRMVPEDIAKWRVRNASGQMVPFSSFSSTRWTFGPPRLERYNGVASMQIQGSAAPGQSSGAAMDAMERLIAQLPAGIGFAWTGLSYQERISGSQAPVLYALSLLVVFLCLAALYESWSVPVAVLLVVPLGVIGAVVATGLRGLSNDVYFQVGLLTTVGLAAKNAILIVEFAKERVEGGQDFASAALHAARLRLRPILMTSLAFGLGVLPLALASGAGSASQNAVGTAVVGGMLASTVLAIFFVPLFFVLVERVATRRKKDPAPVAADSPPADAVPPSSDALPAGER